jgi:hypothetical protein
MRTLWPLREILKELLQCEQPKRYSPCLSRPYEGLAKMGANFFHLVEADTALRIPAVNMVVLQMLLHLLDRSRHIISHLL